MKGLQLRLSLCMFSVVVGNLLLLGHLSWNMESMLAVCRSVGFGASLADEDIYRFREREFSMQCNE